MMQVSAPGYQTITTRVYFSADVRLQQLTTLGGVQESQGLGSAALRDNMQVRGCMCIYMCMYECMTMRKYTNPCTH